MLFLKTNIFLNLLIVFSNFIFFNGLPILGVLYFVNDNFKNNSDLKNASITFFAFFAFTHKVL